MLAHGTSRGRVTSLKVMCLDESGDHNLRKISPIYPLFVLGGVIVERAYVRDVITPRMAHFKRHFFGREDVSLHTVDMGRGTTDYAFLANPVTRAEFYVALNSLLKELEYKVVACVIRKDEYVAQYGVGAADPYRASLDILIERFCEELGLELDSGFICAEKRIPSLDRDLLVAREQLRTVGTTNVSASRIDARIVGFDLRDKKPNLAGLQLADLVITPIGRHLARKPAKADQVDWKVVESKLRRDAAGYQGAGLVVRP